MRLGFCGLGSMGAPMALRLLEDGHDLTVWNRTVERTEQLRVRGASVASTPAEAAAEAKGVITMLADPGALHEVVLGHGGLAIGLEEGSTLIEMSTVGPDAVTAMADRLGPGIRMLDAPVRGSVSEATRGELGIFVGGSDEDFERWRGTLATLGDPVHVGPLGSGASLKLVVNSATGSLVSLLGEALALADRAGIEQRVALDALAGSPMGAVIARTRDNIESGEYPPRFKLALARKDLDLASEMATRGGLELLVAGGARERLRAAEHDGLGDLDFSAVVGHIRGVSAEEGDHPARSPWT